MVVKYIEEWKKQCKDTSFNALVFPPVRKNKRKNGTVAIWPGQWLKNHVQVHADALEIPFKVNFQVLRRSGVTLMRAAGNTSSTELQAWLRHATPDMTEGTYIQPVEENVKKVVNDFAQSFFEVPNTRPKQGPQLVNKK